MKNRVNNEPRVGRASCLSRFGKVVSHVGERFRKAGPFWRFKACPSSNFEEEDRQDACPTLLPCAWNETDRYELPLRTMLRVASKMVRGRRLIRLGESIGQISLQNFIGGQVVRAKRGFATDCSNAVSLGDFARRRVCHGKRPLRVAPPSFRSSLSSRSFSSSRLDLVANHLVTFRRRHDFRSDNAALREHRPAEPNVLLIAITRTTPTTRTILLKQICPGGQRPDWLRESVSNDAKISVSSRRSAKGAPPRSRPRQIDL